MIEIWHPVVGYEALYEVSNCGRVKSLKWGKERILKNVYNSKNSRYLTVCLSKNGKHKIELIHRLVAKAFIPNPNGYTTVHHKDHNRHNNYIDNLEWISKESHYVLHITDRAKGVFEKKTKTVYQYTLDWKLVKVWPSTISCKKEGGFNQGMVASCCRGEIEQYKGYRWSYVLL